MFKTISFAVVHFSVAFTVGYILTGDMIIGGTIALIEPAVNTVAYHFHEKVWSRLSIKDKAPVSAATKSKLSKTLATA